ncbi:prenyltransferase/squalene oxidase repeat-containing protein [Archangium violaceum]|uniref:prenyltransferase/squalene oxidase repeat-containing protein n=1 Tax=Archangium violaceum TaxID=83451 RepID=UPI0036D9ABA4
MRTSPYMNVPAFEIGRPAHFPSKHGAAVAREQLREYLEAQVGEDGCVRGQCESRVLESVLSLHLLEQVGLYPEARGQLESYLRAQYIDEREDPLHAVLRRQALGESTRRDAQAVRAYLAHFDHFTAQRKRVMFSVLMAVLGLTPFDPELTWAEVAGGEEKYQSWVNVVMASLRIIHAMGCGHPEWVSPGDVELLTISQSTNGAWEKHLLANILALLALRHFPLHCLSLQNGIGLLVSAQNADGGIPFIAGLEIFCTATAGLALAGAGASPALLHRMADYLVGEQKRNGGWAYAEDVHQTDVDDTAYCLEFLRAAAPVRHAHAIERAEQYLVDMQGSDGGFPTFVAGSKPEIAMTAGAINALAPNCEQHAALIARGIRYIITHQKADGTFERSWSLSETNAIFRALLAMRRLPESASGLRLTVELAEEYSLDYLRRSQNVDGGWGQRAGDASDPISTSYALIALSHFDEPTTIECGVRYLVRQQQADGRFLSIPDQAGPRPIAWNVPVLSEIFALLAFDHVLAARPAVAMPIWKAMASQFSSMGMEAR